MISLDIYTKCKVRFAVNIYLNDLWRREKKSQEALNMVDAINKKYNVNESIASGDAILNK